MRDLDIQAITKLGSVFYTSIQVREDYSMNEVVKTIKERGYVAFRILENKMKFVYLHK